MLEVITAGAVQVHVPPDLTVLPTGGHPVVLETRNDPEPLDID